MNSDTKPGYVYEGNLFTDLERKFFQRKITMYHINQTLHSYHYANRVYGDKYLVFKYEVNDSAECLQHMNWIRQSWTRYGLDESGITYDYDPSVPLCTIYSDKKKDTSLLDRVWSEHRTDNIALNETIDLIIGNKTGILRSGMFIKHGLHNKLECDRLGLWINENLKDLKVNDFKTFTKFQIVRNGNDREDGEYCEIHVKKN